jgi:hypothetical protein
MNPVRDENRFKDLQTEHGLSIQVSESVHI